MNVNNNEKSYVMKIHAAILDKRQITKVSILSI